MENQFYKLKKKYAIQDSSGMLHLLWGCATGCESVIWWIGIYQSRKRRMRACTLLSLGLNHVVTPVKWSVTRGPATELAMSSITCRGWFTCTVFPSSLCGHHVQRPAFPSLVTVTSSSTCHCYPVWHNFLGKASKLNRWLIARNRQFQLVVIVQKLSEQKQLARVLKRPLNVRTTQNLV